MHPPNTLHPFTVAVIDDAADDGCEFVTSKIYTPRLVVNQGQQSPSRLDDERHLY